MKVYLHEDSYKSIERRLICNSPNWKAEAFDSRGMIQQWRIIGVWTNLTTKEGVSDPKGENAS